MKVAIHSIDATSDELTVVVGEQVFSYPQASREYVTGPFPQARRDSSAMRIVGILAFCQSLMFLALWLLMCAAAGAANAPIEFVPDLKTSTYQPTNARDPFAKPGIAMQATKTAPTIPISLQLQGILYQPANPSAIVNDKLLTLNKIVSFNTGNSEVQVKAVEITRESVVLDIGGQRVELRLSPSSPPAPAAQ